MSTTTITSPASDIHGLAMLQAASLALGDQADLMASPTPSPTTSPPPGAPSNPPTNTRLTDLLNPAPSGIASSLPPGFVLGKDGKIKKKRGRKPTPGLTDEGRRQARLMKNRRTAEISRRRKMALLNRLTEERDDVVALARSLHSSNAYLVDRLAYALGMSVDALVRADPVVAHSRRALDVPEALQSDVSQPASVADSDDEPFVSNAVPPAKS